MAKLGQNPKDLIGQKKVSITKFPMAALVHGAKAMSNGAEKYGPYNWRGNAVIASIYVDAVMRHLAAWFDEKEEVATDSGVHHLAHALASVAILIDAMETGNLIDDRPEGGKAASVLARLNNVARPTVDVNRSWNPVVDASVRPVQPEGHIGVSEKSNGLVCSTGTPEDDATGHF